MSSATLIPGFISGLFVNTFGTFAVANVAALIALLLIPILVILLIVAAVKVSQNEKLLQQCQGSGVKTANKTSKKVVTFAAAAK
jgi:hypothetical protein